MGVWGTGPFDNDDASDMVAELMDPIHRVLKFPVDVPLRRTRGKHFRTRASDFYSKARAAAAIILLAHGTDILGGPRLELVLQALKKMRTDKKWIETWGHPKRTTTQNRVLRSCLVESINSQIRAVQRKIRVCCHRRIKTVNRRGRVLRRRRP
jgi:Domain of unknown function (DUF4259)